jgi:NAD(P)H-dependent FMN reductase
MRQLVARTFRENILESDSKSRRRKEDILFMKSLNVLGVSSSMREGSFGSKTLKIVLDTAQKYEAKTRLLELRKMEMPLYNPDSDSSMQSNMKLQKVTDDVNWADAFVLVSPDYHGSISGSMKNFLDYYWEEFAGKTFGYICTSHEKGLTVIDQMRTSKDACPGFSCVWETNQRTISSRYIK